MEYREFIKLLGALAGTQPRPELCHINPRESESDHGKP